MQHAVISLLSNSASLRANNQITRSTLNINRTLERLATGKRVNKASDDPAGMIAITNFKVRQAEIEGEIRGLQSQQFAADATEGGLSSVAEMLQELNALVVSAANTAATSPQERHALQIQADSILATIDWLGNTTEFKGARILTGINTGTMGQTAYTQGSESEKQTATLADLRTGGALNLISGNTDAAQQTVKAALDAATTQRAALGAQSRSLDSRINTLRVELENTVAARGQIEDTDYASETAALAREQTMQQAAVYVGQLASRHRAEMVMELLKSLPAAKQA